MATTQQTRISTSLLVTASMATTQHGSGNDNIHPIRFFKIILQTNLETLKIPNKFTCRYGGGLRNPVLIKPPDGTEWEVHWTKENDEIWFKEGWKQFVENYSVNHGHLVLFKYEGTSQFEVLILGQSGLEIDYSPSDDENDNLDHSDDDSVKILDKWPHPKARQTRGKNTTQKTSSLNWPKEVRAREVAGNFTSEYPFFTVQIKPFNLAESRLSIPDLEGYIENKEKYVKLQLGERSWNVKLLRRWQSSSCRSLTAGFLSFATEIELVPGDVCVFEMISSVEDDLVFKVNVFKSHC